MYIRKFKIICDIYFSLHINDVNVQCSSKIFCILAETHVLYTKFHVAVPLLFAYKKIYFLILHKMETCFY